MGQGKLKGVVVSEGIGAGNLFVLKQPAYGIRKSKIPYPEIDSEIGRLEKALDKTLEEICDLSDSLRKRLERQENLVFEAYKAMLKDRYFIQEIKDIILTNHCYAEFAVDLCVKGYVHAIEVSDNEYAKQGIYDLNDVGSKIIKNLMGDSEENFNGVYRKQIVAVKQLTTSVAAALGKRKVMGVIAEEGASYYSHGVIILRGLGIPVLGGIKLDAIKRHHQCAAVIDGVEGILLIEPDKYEYREYREIIKKKIQKKRYRFWKQETKALTRDGTSIKLLASVNNVEECNYARDHKVEGIGLVRTEMLFIHHNGMPDEEDQYHMYSQIIKSMKKKQVVFRTMDIGGDKTIGYLGTGIDLMKQNLRGIKRSLANIEEFEPQLVSILKAGKGENLWITFPVVENAQEVIEAKKLIHQVEQRVGTGNPLDCHRKIGAFIESHQGIKNIDGILQETDFVSIGTNDLLREFIQQNHGKPNKSEDEYLNPEFIKLVKYCIDKAYQHEKAVSICGEMAGDEGGAVLLVGMGAVSLTVHTSRLIKLKEMLGKIEYREANALVEEVLQCTMISQVREKIQAYRSSRM